MRTKRQPVSVGLATLIFKSTRLSSVVAFDDDDNFQCRFEPSQMETKQTHTQKSNGTKSVKVVTLKKKL